MSRIDINRLLRRVDAMESRRMQRRPRRTFRMIVENHLDADAEIARFCAANGVADSDFLIVRTIIPCENRPGETAAEAYQRELATLPGSRGLGSAMPSL